MTGVQTCALPIWLYQYDGTFAGTKPPDNKPNYRTIEIGSGGRWTQLALPWDNDGFFFRRQQDATYTSWRTVLHDGNYGGYSTFSGSVTSTYGNFTSPGLIIGDAQYGLYVASGNVYYKSASGGVHYWRNIANSANTMSLDNSGNLTIAGSFTAAGTITEGGYLAYPERV